MSMWKKQSENMISMYNDSRIRSVNNHKEREGHGKEMKVKEMSIVKKVKRKEIGSRKKHGHRRQT